MTPTSLPVFLCLGLLTHVSNSLGRLVPQVPALPGFCRIRKYEWLSYEGLSSPSLFLLKIRSHSIFKIKGT